MYYAHLYFQLPSILWMPGTYSVQTIVLNIKSFVGSIAPALLAEFTRSIIVYHINTHAINTYLYYNYIALTIFTQYSIFY